MLGQPQSFFDSARAVCRTVAICRQSHSRCSVAWATTTMVATKSMSSLSAANMGFSPGYLVVGNFLDCGRARV